PASGYEAAPTLQASKVLPVELRSGAHFRVADKVANDGYINTYHLTSKFGTFTAVSTAMLAKRIGEVNALVVMEQVKGTTEFTNALKKAGSGVVGSAKNLVTHPVESLTLQRHLNIDTRPFSWYLFLNTHNSTRRERMLPACRTADETFAIPQFALTRSD